MLRRPRRNVHAHRGRLGPRQLDRRVLGCIPAELEPRREGARRRQPALVPLLGQRARGAGAPRVSLPIETGSGTSAFYAFIAAFYCNDGAGLVDALNDPTCTIFAGSESFSSWGALLAAHPDWRVGPNLPFVIADETGTWTVADVQLGKGPAKGA